jgi:hypothetical protein
MTPSLPIAFLGDFAVGFGSGEKLGALVFRGAGAESSSESDSGAIDPLPLSACPLIGLHFFELGFGCGEEPLVFMAGAFPRGGSSYR